MVNYIFKRYKINKIHWIITELNNVNKKLWKKNLLIIFLKLLITEFWSKKFNLEN